VSTTTAGILFLASLIVALVAVHVPLGDYMYRVYTSNKDSRGERAIYRLIGADPKAEQTWGAYVRSVLAFSAISILFLFIFQLVQGKLPLHLNDPATQMTPALAWNTASIPFGTAIAPIYQRTIGDFAQSGFVVIERHAFTT